MKFTHKGEEHEVFLVDSGTLDTVIKVDGKEQTYSQEFAAEFRDAEGTMTESGLVALAKDAIDGGWLEGDELTDEAEAKYLASPDHCPFCDSEQIEAGPYRSEELSVISTVSCTSCGEAWVDEYTVTNIREL
jgi:hypothetical protein